MGYIKHDAVIALLYEEPHPLQELQAFLDALPEPFRRYFLGPVEGRNGMLTFVVTPDGSKEGWEHSEQMDRLRSQFIGIVKKARYHELVHLRFGGDDRGTTISFASESRDWESDEAEG
jgi:hypothetical protein